MRASELTLGSWVIATNNGVCPLPEKIAKMLPGAGRIVNLDYDFVVLDFVDFGLMLDAIEPVPLTADILEKNGWRQYSPYFSNDNADFELDPYRDGGFGIRVSADEYGSGTFACIKYVHQLQQALRLFGIEKEVQL